MFEERRSTSRCWTGHRAVLVVALVLGVVLSGTSSAEPVADKQDEQEPAPQVLLDLSRFRDDESAFVKAWAKAREQLADARIKEYLAQVQADDGTLLADLALLAPELDILPSGNEGPGRFIWVRHAASMKREIINSPKERDFFNQTHWNDGSLGWYRDTWENLAPSQPPDGCALRHLVLIPSYLKNSFRSDQLWNDGLPFTTGYYQHELAPRIAKEAYDRSFPSITVMPPRKPTWADRCVIEAFYNYFDIREIESIPPAVVKMYRETANNLDQVGWLGFVSVAPPAALQSELGYVSNKDVRWHRLEKMSPILIDDQVNAPGIDWKTWAATGQCLVAIDSGRFLFGEEPRYKPADMLEIPVLLITKSDGSRGGQVLMCLPGHAPIHFGWLKELAED